MIVFYRIFQFYTLASLTSAITGAYHQFLMAGIGLIMCLVIRWDIKKQQLTHKN